MKGLAILFCFLCSFASLNAQNILQDDFLFLKFNHDGVTQHKTDISYIYSGDYKKCKIYDTHFAFRIASMISRDTVDLDFIRSVKVYTIEEIEKFTNQSEDNYFALIKFLKKVNLSEDKYVTIVETHPEKQEKLILTQVKWIMFFND
jgi:hypothetical protein